jgi:hypothetical protein
MQVKFYCFVAHENLKGIWGKNKTVARLLQILLKAMKSKGLVIAGIVLIIISLIFGAYFAPIYNQAGKFGISGIDPDQVVPLIIFVVIFFIGVGLLVKDIIQVPGKFLLVRK